MRCPHCGSPVMIRGSYWECGWCGDCGMLQRTQQKKAAAAPASRYEYTRLPLIWAELKSELGKLAPRNARLSGLLGKALLHFISLGIHHSNTDVGTEQMQELDLFLNSAADLKLGERVSEIKRDLQKGVIFEKEAALSEQSCGEFWTELLSVLPREQYYDRPCESLDSVFTDLSIICEQFYQYEGDSDNAWRCSWVKMKDEFYGRWKELALLHPNVERSRRLLSRGEFPMFEDVCRDILITEYPEEIHFASVDEFAGCSWQGILCDKFEENMELGIKMWRTLLDAAEPALWTDAETASKMLPDWEWLIIPNKEMILPLLDALRDEHFAKQVFQSADPCGSVQYDVLSACFDYDRWDVGVTCLELAMANPHLEKQWIDKFRRFYPPRDKKRLVYVPNRPANDPLPDDGTVFHYCSVQIPGIHRTYAYLTGGLPLKAGDWVELPFGKENRVRRARVCDVMDCTRLVAPWPPEKTKTVLRIAEPPAPKPKKKAPEPEPEEWVIRIGPEPDEIEEAPEPAEIGKEPKPAEEAENKADQAQPEPPAATEEKAPEPPRERSQFAISYEAYLNRNPWKKREIEYEKHPGRKRIIKRVLALAAVCAVVVFLVVRKEQRARIYDTALEYLSEQEFLKAELEFSKLQRYRDAAQLAVYCKYASAYRTNTNYTGGAEELSYIHLQFETGWQQDVDALEKRVEGYKKQKESEEAAALRAQEAAAAASWDEELKRIYTGKQPVDGMPANGLKYTTLGAPSQTKNCRDYNSLVYNRRYKTLYWYNSQGQTIASCKSHQLSENGEEVIYDFTTFNPPLGSSKPTSSIGGSSSFGGSSGSSHSGSIRDDYDTPEDLWEDNQDWYEDEDEAWDEWYDG